MAHPTQRRDLAAIIRGLAAEKGYTAERAVVRGHWILTDDATGKPAMEPNGTIAFGERQAIRLSSEAREFLTR